MTRIFLLDDDKDISYVMKTWFTNKGYEVITFSSSKSLLHKLESDTPDIVLLDVLISEQNTNGLMLSQRIKEENEYTGPVYLFTAKQLRKKEIEDSRADGVVLKPFDFAAVEQTIQQALNDSYYQPFIDYFF